MSRLRSKTRPRCLKGTPTASNSRAYQPAATPRTRRPPEITSRLPRALAVTTGLRRGSTSTPVPSLILLVRAATAPRVVIESMMGKRLEAEGLGALGVGVEARDIRDLAGADEIADGQTEVGHGNLLSL